MTSKPFCLLLAHMTELELVEDIIKLDPGKSLLSKPSGTGSGMGTEAEGKSTPGAESDTVELKSSALCRGDLFRWCVGDYSLAGDPSDPGLGRFCLEAVCSFNCEGSL